jgi:hydrogenase expression/formation protein HypC
MKLMTRDADGLNGVVDAGGSPLAVGLTLTPEAQVGDYVLVHAGAAIEVLASDEARDILQAFDEFAKAQDLFTPPTPTDEP